MRRILTGVLWVGLFGASLLASGATADDGSGLVEAFGRLERATRWRVVERVPLQFDAGHPQGLARVGEEFWLSSVRVDEPPRRYPSPDAQGFDRSPGRGTGWLFRFDGQGRLLDSLRLGEGSVYHPGGVDFDGRHLWLPVAEYRPRGRSVILRIDPGAPGAEVQFAVGDHVGALAVDGTRGLLFGASWGSRTFYTWDLQGTELARAANPSHHVDLQDWKYLGDGLLLGGGVVEWHPPMLSGSPGGPRPTGAGAEHPLQVVGGLELWDSQDWRPLRLVPVAALAAPGVALTRNAVDFTVVEGRLRLYAVPEDGRSTLWVVESEAR